MDLDVFTDTHEAEWARLDALVRRRSLSGAEADELIRLYQAVATHLSTVRSAAPDPALVSRLSLLLTRARARATGSHDPSWRDVKRFALVVVPAALYRVRWWTHAVTAACVLVAAVVAVNLVLDPDLVGTFWSPLEQEQYVNRAFEEYYEPGVGFGVQVWTNNAWIAAQSVAFGITGAWPVYVLLQNAVNVGAVAGLMAVHDRLDVFFALILPHGLLELTAIFVAGGAGLKLFWTVIDPGNRPRMRAVAEEGRALMSVALGLVAVLGLSGLIEGFITGSGLPWWLKIAIGVVALAAFWTWVTVFGRRAVADGESGDLTEDDAGAAVPLAV